MWSFFQAKNVRRTATEIASDQAKMNLPSVTDPSQKLLLTGLGRRMHIAPQAKAYHAHLIPVHIKLPLNHTRGTKSGNLANVCKLHSLGV